MGVVYLARAPGHRPQGRDQGAAPGAVARPGGRGALLQRGARDPHHRAREHRRDPRLRPDPRRPALLHHGVPGRRGAERRRRAAGPCAGRGRARSPTRCAARSAPRTPRGSSTAISSRTTSSSSTRPTGCAMQVKILDFGVAKILRRRPTAPVGEDAHRLADGHAALHVARAVQGRRRRSTTAPTSTRSA